MKLKTLRFIFFLTVIFLITLSCNKAKSVRNVEIAFDGDVYHNSAKFNVIYNNSLQRLDYQEIGIVWSTSPNPSASDNYYSLYSDYTIAQSEQGNYTYTASDLHANTHYYVRAYMAEPEDSDNNDYNDYIHSSTLEFTTPALPACPCSVNTNVINFSGVDKSMLLGNLTNDGSPYAPVQFQTATDVGDFIVHFGPDPRSGIYKTYALELPYSEGDVFYTRINGHVPETYNCEYVVEDDQDVYVNNDGLGNVSISFCDLVFTTSDPCSNQYIISGEIRNY